MPCKWGGGAVVLPCDSMIARPEAQSNTATSPLKSPGSVPARSATHRPIAIVPVDGYSYAGSLTVAMVECPTRIDGRVELRLGNHAHDAVVQ